MGRTLKYLYPKGKKIPNTRLTPIRITTIPGPNGSQDTAYECRCDCGKTVCVKPNVVGKGVRSCGCLKIDAVKETHTTHGLSKTPEYFAAWGAFNRCTNKRNDRWRDYGGRGIRCEFKDVGEMTKWLKMNLPKPNPHAILDRKNNNGNYSKDNLRWVDYRTSMRNRRGVHPATINGETKLLCEWSELTGIGPVTIRERIDSGMPEDLWLFKGKITKRLLLEREYAKS